MAPAFLDGLPLGEQRRLLALLGLLPLGGDGAAVRARLERLVAEDPDRFLAAIAHEHAVLAALWQALVLQRNTIMLQSSTGMLHGNIPMSQSNTGMLQRSEAMLQRSETPGRAAALLAVARALGRPLPAAEYQLPDATLAALLERAARLRGRRIPARGPAGHKGRVGDAVERMLLGTRARGRGSDHPAAEIKSVPVRGGDVLERVKLGVLSPRSNPLAKCDRVLFVFVEQRGDDHFVAGHALGEFDGARWAAMWRDGWVVETAAGSPRRPARGLYLVPRWFRAAGLWPPG